MNVHEQGTDELTGNGLIIIDGQDAGTVYYALTLVGEPGDLIAEGSIIGPEDVLARVTAARQVRLAVEDGPVLTLSPQGGDDGIRWVSAMHL